MEVSRSLKGKGVKNTAGVIMVLGVMPEFFGKTGLSSLTMSEVVCSAGGGRNKVTEIRVEGVIVESNNQIRAEAGSWAAVNVIFEKDGRGSGFQGIEAMYPRS